MASEVAVDAGGVAFPAGDAETVAAEAVEVLKQPHNLERKWTFWFDNQSKKQGAAWGTSLRKVYTFEFRHRRKVEKFWCLYDQIFQPSKLTVNADSICSELESNQNGKIPIPECANGGKWTVPSSLSLPLIKCGLRL